MMLIAMSVVLAYLLGSLQFGILLSSLFGYADPRGSGSGNSGATNVARSSGMKVGLLVLLGDVLKGVVAVVLSRQLGLGELGQALVGLAAVIGHMYPIYYQFKGGKGVATAFGVVCALSLPAALLGIVVMVAVVFLTKYVSLGSMLAGVAIAVYMGVTDFSYATLVIFAMLLLVIWRHSANIQRLLAGSENKFCFKPKGS
jgi:acyl phosphate:glycerol-3-phosphate acyltransferase